jgi:hypothetical protein
MTPALNFCEVAVFREPLKIFRGELSRGDAQSGELLADERVSGHGAIEAQQWRAGNRPILGIGPKMPASQKSTFTQRTLLSLLTAHTERADYLARSDETIRILVRSLADAHGIAASYPPME